MTIKQLIEKDLKAALLDGDKKKATTLRGIKSAILNAEIEQSKRDDGLDDQSVMIVLAKEAKSRQDSADIYKNAGEQERTAQELEEKAIIENYLPKQMDDSELKFLVQEVVDELKAAGMKDMGKVIGGVKARAQGQADGSRIAQVVKESLSK